MPTHLSITRAYNAKLEGITTVKRSIKYLAVAIAARPFFFCSISALMAASTLPACDPAMNNAVH
jgi:hypothetical protein